VLRYEPDLDRWTVALATEAPFFMTRPRFTSLRAPAIVLYVLYGAFILTCVAAIAADVDQISLLNDIEAGEPVSLQEVLDSDDFYAAAKGFQGLAILAIIPFFIWWTRRATCNVSALGARNPDFSPGWAVGGWFVPFANWVQPLRVLNQAWRASDDKLPVEESTAWEYVSVTPLLLIWWLGYTIGGGIWNAAFQTRDDTGSASALADATTFVLVMDLIIAGIAGLAIAVVALLTVRQDRANGRFDVQATPNAPVAAGVAVVTPVEAVQGS
jgi:hypothetical protein